MICGFLLATVAQAGACVEVPSDRIVAGQLVDAVPVLWQLAPGTSLGFAPLPGLVRVISGRELSLIASRDGAEQGFERDAQGHHEGLEERSPVFVELEAGHTIADAIGESQ